MPACVPATSARRARKSGCRGDGRRGGRLVRYAQIMPPKAKLTREQKAAREEAARKAREAALKYLDENECGPEVGTGRWVACAVLPAGRAGTRFVAFVDCALTLMVYALRSVASARDNTLELRRARKAKEAADKAASLRAKLAAQQAKVATDLAAAGVSLGGGGAGALMGAVTDGERLLSAVTCDP